MSFSSSSSVPSARSLTNEEREEQERAFKDAYEKFHKLKKLVDETVMESSDAQKTVTIRFERIDFVLAEFNLGHSEDFVGRLSLTGLRNLLSAIDGMLASPSVARAKRAHPLACLVEDTAATIAKLSARGFHHLSDTDKAFLLPPRAAPWLREQAAKFAALRRRVDALVAAGRAAAPVLTWTAARTRWSYFSRQLKRGDVITVARLRNILLEIAALEEREPGPNQLIANAKSVVVLDCAPALADL